MCVHDVESFPRRHRLHRESAASGLVFSQPWCSGKCSLEPGKSCRKSKMRSKLQHGTHETTKAMNPREKKMERFMPKRSLPPENGRNLYGDVSFHRYVFFGVGNCAYPALGTLQPGSPVLILPSGADPWLENTTLVG